ncbi:hypothetical protein [Leptospira meyeri]|uniref:hypothetical protein n=1 Tax=Leptospira meyeri TaxID=29508 RepID=UPI000C2A2DFF|nr:hypothetical protein [Leptospira meyeri]PKA25133.1 hypothetical protein CH381_17300 [Leptospira sp. mixed culture ATI2-C-A1]TGM17618.1 hypothetical protein EHQ73_18450 [Leptospira meyeri]
MKVVLLLFFLLLNTLFCTPSKKNELTDVFILGSLFLSQKNISFRIVDSQNPQFLLQNAKSGLGNQSLPNRFLNDGKLNHSVGCTKARINVHSIFLWEKGIVSPGQERIANATTVVYDGSWIDNQSGSRMKVSYPLDSGKTIFGIGGPENANAYAWKDGKYDRIGLRIGSIKCELDESKLENQHNKYFIYNMWNESEIGKADPQFGKRNIVMAYPFDNSIEKVNTIEFPISETTGYLALDVLKNYHPRIHRNSSTEAAELADPIGNPFWDLLNAPYTDRLDFEYLDNEYSMDRYTEDGIIVLNLPEGNRETLVLNMSALNNFVYQTEQGLPSAKFSPIDFIKFDYKPNEYHEYYLNTNFITTNGKYLEQWVLPTPGPNQPDPSNGRDIGFFLPTFSISKE